MTHPSNRLAGKRIIIIGGTGGIGMAMAERFLNEGAKVIIAARDEKKWQKSANV